MNRTPQSQSQLAHKPALRIDNVDTSDPVAVGFDIEKLCADLGCTEVCKALVPLDNQRYVGNARNPNWNRGRGFAIVLFASNAAAADALTKLDGHIYEHARLRVAWDRRSPRSPTGGDDLARSAAKLVLTETLLKEKAEAPEKSLDEYPALPEASLARVPIVVPRPVAHVVRSKPRSSAGSSSSSARICFYCGCEGHVVADCAQLASRMCKVCSGFGHTERHCPLNQPLTTEIFAAY